MFIQAGFAVDPPTACHLVWIASYMKADLTHQLVRRCVHKLAVIPASLVSIGSHLLHLKTETFISFQQFTSLRITKQQKLFCTICRCEVKNNATHPVYM